MQGFSGHVGRHVNVHGSAIGAELGDAAFFEGRLGAVANDGDAALVERDGRGAIGPDEDIEGGSPNTEQNAGHDHAIFAVDLFERETHEALFDGQGAQTGNQLGFGLQADHVVVVGLGEGEVLGMEVLNAVGGQNGEFRRHIEPEGGAVAGENDLHGPIVAGEKRRCALGDGDIRGGHLGLRQGVFGRRRLAAGHEKTSQHQHPEEKDT